MILPAKHLRQNRALLGLGAEILEHLHEPQTVSELWERVRSSRDSEAIPLSFDSFVLTLSFLYAVSAIDLTDGLIGQRAHQ